MSVLKTYSREQIAKQNILTLFRWIESGSLEEIELNNLICFIKEQLEILKKESAPGKVSCPQVYGCLDDSFLNAVLKDYGFGSDNRLLLDRLFAEAAGEIKTGKDIPEAAARHPWLDIKNSLTDCLENEVIISFPGKTNTDLTKPEIFAAPDINSIVDLMNKSILSVLNIHVNLSGAYRLVHKGSTARGVSLDNAEFDFDPLFASQKDYDLFLKKLPLILNALSEIWKANGVSILSEDSDNQYPWGRLINLIALDKDWIVFRVQLLAGKDRKSWIEFINGQMAQIKALDGSWEYVSGQIILFKRLVRDVLHGYGKSYGGLDGMMCVEFILQADSSVEYGRRITTIGSFDKTMRWVYRIGFDQASSAIIPFDIATKQTGIYSPDPNKLPITCSSIFWNKLVNAARKYVELDKVEMSEDEFAGLGINPDRISGQLYEVI